MKHLFEILIISALIFSSNSINANSAPTSSQDFSLSATSHNTTTAIHQHGITWSFATPVKYGQFANGDYWVVGPVVITKISTSWHNYPGDGYDGSMVNPPTTGLHGYDSRIGGYTPSLNVRLSLPRTLNSGESIISTVSWVLGEPGIPNVNGGTGTPRPVLRDAAILTSLAQIPPNGSFRPPYCGTTKTLYSTSQLKKNLLLSLAPVASTPALSTVEALFERPWIDHVHEYLGAYFHPSSNMPQYGRDVSDAIGDGALMLLLNESVVGNKDTFLIRYVQLGIDLYGIFSNGGSWPSNGGHQQGRKWPILFAGLMLNNQAMLDVGALPVNNLSGTAYFQEDGDTFYGTQADIDMVHNPDIRAEYIPYTQSDLGLPEWGIRHSYQPKTDNRNYYAVYRDINSKSYIGWVLAARLMQQKPLWGHDALFDYVDRWMVEIAPVASPKLFTDSQFTRDMWNTYRK